MKYIIVCLLIVGDCSDSVVMSECYEIYIQKAGASLEVFQWGGVGPSEYRQGHLGTDIFHMYYEMR